MICLTQASLIALIMSARHLGMPVSVVLVLWSLRLFPVTPKRKSAFPAMTSQNICREKGFSQLKGRRRWYLNSNSVYRLCQKLDNGVNTEY